MWAKTSEGATKWHPLPLHMREAAEVAGVLWDHWLAPSTRQRICGELGAPPDGARRFVQWIVGLHDLGKASPGFQFQVPNFAPQLESLGLDNPGELPYGDRVRHEIISGADLAKWLERNTQVGSANAIGLGELVASHHGVVPGSGWRDRPAERLNASGRRVWKDIRQRILTELTEALKPVPVLDGAGPPGNSWCLSQATRWTISGLMILSDWLASSEEFFAHICRTGEPAPPLEPHIASASARAAEAVRSAGLGDHWSPPRYDHGEGNLFEERFGFSSPRPVQRAAAEAALALDGPGMVVIEAPMGEGKTEAALVAAEIVAQRFGLGGVFVGLPTQATGNQMFGRVRDWLGTQRGHHVLHLAHGGAWLNPDYQRLREVSKTVAIDRQSRGETTIDVSAWLAGRKRALLAPFVVGTVDQLLLAALNARHLALRFVGLTNKVVIVDEVHAYDAYMSVFLRTALAWLGAAGVPVILLSATLPPTTRRDLLTAYSSGVPVPPSGGDRTCDSESGSTGYPLITSIGTESTDEPVITAPDGATAMNNEFRVEWLNEEPDARCGPELVDLLMPRIEDGGCVLVVRNTVARAQETYEALLEALPTDEVTLAHSRFTRADRSRLEESLLGRFGKNGNRPTRHVVVGTQVLEQSLDVDFDLVVTDLAPVDLVLQRAGRCHRHPNRRPAALEHPVLVIAGSTEGPDGPMFASGSSFIYSEYRLLRSHSALRARSTILFPEGIPSLVSEVYPDGGAVTTADEGDDRLHLAFDKERAAIAGAESTARTLALGPPSTDTCERLGAVTGQATGNTVDDESNEARAAVRQIEPTVEVVIAVDGTTGPRLLDGTVVDVSSEPDFDRARLLATQVVTLPPYLTGDALELLPQPPGWARVPGLRNTRLLPIPQEGFEMNRHIITYDRSRGLLIRRETTGG